MFEITEKMWSYYIKESLYKKPSISVLLLGDSGGIIFSRSELKSGASKLLFSVCNAIIHNGFISSQHNKKSGFQWKSAF